jgi:hypothetical protein
LVRRWSYIAKVIAGEISIIGFCSDFLWRNSAHVRSRASYRGFD